MNYAVCVKFQTTNFINIMTNMRDAPDDDEHHDMSQCGRQSEHIQLLLDCDWSSSCIVKIMAMLMLHNDNYGNDDADADAAQ